ncbi:glycosyltransferase family 2 protein [Shewanella woodyi]|uniref:glycosyltransferase family 2 protein n=1 Tax=Shewanella woodyi TaxID=60961 RepID=UPI0007E935E9|nr:glycosyltransferase family A protein [Shewanella woodyi]
MESSLVSTIIPTYNRADNLCRAIDSALNQTHKYIEVIVVDDNDPLSEARAETEYLMQKYLLNDNVKYVKHLENKNGAAARNTGISASFGKYIAFLDDDDEWEPNKIEKQVEYLKGNHIYGGCYCLSKKYMGGNKFYSTKYKVEGNLMFDLLSLKSEIYTPTLLLRKEFVNNIGGFDESFIRHQDFELLVKFFEKYTLGCVPEYLVNIHVDDCQNHPSFQQFEGNKLTFLSKFTEFIAVFPKKKQRAIYQAHYFELFYYAMKSRCYSNAVLYFFKGMPKPKYLWANRLKILSLVKKKLF